jgi:hypothetical protein
LGYMKINQEATTFRNRFRKRKDTPMNTIIRLGQMLVVPSLLVLARLRRSAVKQRIGQRFCARISDSRIMFVDPRPSDVDSMPSFNFIDGQPIR